MSVDLTIGVIDKQDVFFICFLYIYLGIAMKYIIGAVLISSLIFFLFALFINATGLMPSQSILQYSWIVWGVLTVLCYPLAKKIMV